MSRSQAGVAGNSGYNGNSHANGPYRPVRSGQSAGWLNMSTAHWDLVTEPRMEALS